MSAGGREAIRLFWRTALTSWWRLRRRTCPSLSRGVVWKERVRTSGHDREMEIERGRKLGMGGIQRGTAKQSLAVTTERTSLTHRGIIAEVPDVAGHPNTHAHINTHTRTYAHTNTEPHTHCTLSSTFPGVGSSPKSRISGWQSHCPAEQREMNETLQPACAVRQMPTLNTARNGLHFLLITT